MEVQGKALLGMPRAGFNACKLCLRQEE